MTLPYDEEPLGEPDARYSFTSPSKLLPAFEPSSSSPKLPRPLKRKLAGSPPPGRAILQHYPTPVPTSSTAIPPSSPPEAQKTTRPGLNRTLSTLSERQPLGTVPYVELPANGEPVLMGRSSNSSHYQLSANRLISRVHVSASYRVAESEKERAKIIVECLGWNGCKVHSLGKAVELGKGDTFSSDKPLAEIILDVQDARVLLKWPAMHRTGSVAATSDATWDNEASPQRTRSLAVDRFPSSPPQARIHLHSPVSPSPRDRAGPTASSTFLGMPYSSPVRASVQVYEDMPSDDNHPSSNRRSADIEPEITSASKASESSSSLSALEDFSDADEENDPIIHSFGVFGESLLPRMASISAASPARHRRPLAEPTSPTRASTSAPAALRDDLSPIRNHAINQLAYSRLHSLPLSTIMNNLPASMKDSVEIDGLPPRNALTDTELKKLLHETPCIGEIAREGKDAAGKPLEDDFYYVAEMDTDQGRRDAVENSLGKSGLRAVRKQHKQYFWKRPRY